MQGADAPPNPKQSAQDDEYPTAQYCRKQFPLRGKPYQGCIVCQSVGHETPDNATRLISYNTLAGGATHVGPGRPAAGCANHAVLTIGLVSASVDQDQAL